MYKQGQGCQHKRLQPCCTQSLAGELRSTTLRYTSLLPRVPAMRIKVVLAGLSQQGTITLYTHNSILYMAIYSI